MWECEFKRLADVVLTSFARELKERITRVSVRPSHLVLERRASNDGVHLKQVDTLLKD